MMSLLALLAFAPAPVHAAAGASAFLEVLPGGARWRGMGGAARAVATDADAGFWNPAGLARSGPEVWQAAAMLETGAPQGTIASLAGSWLTDAAGTWGAAWARRFGGGFERVDGLGTVVGTREDDAEDALLVSWARDVVYQLRAGVTVKGLRQRLFDFTAGGAALDLGATAQPWLAQPFVCSVTVENAASVLAWSTGGRDRLDRGLALGLAWRGWRSRLLVAADAVVREGAPAVGVHAGAEARVLPVAAVRGGWDDGAPAAGATYELGPYALDYAWTAGRRGLAARHQASFRLRF